MNNLNVAILEGNLTRDPELKIVGNDLKICQFSIACNTGFGDKEYANYFEVKVFGKNAENCQKFLVKGQSVKVIGSLKQERWNDQEGHKKSKITIEANQVIFGAKKDSQSNTANNDNSQEQSDPDDSVF